MSDSKPRPYITERTKMWRSRDPKAKFIEAIDVIEEHGCQLMHVAADDVCPRFSYSAGVYDTSGKPELITVGLTADTAHSALNKAVLLMKEGVDLTVGRHGDIIGNVEVEFRKVDSKWLHQVMLRADWFYDGEDVPVLQLIFPDLENRFQDEDDNFNEFFVSPSFREKSRTTHSPTISGLHTTMQAASRTGLFPILLTRVPICRKLFRTRKSPSHMSPTTKTVTGNFLVTKCLTAAAPFFRACIIQLTMTAHSNNYTTCHSTGMPRAKLQMRHGNYSSTLQRTRTAKSNPAPHCQTD